MTACCMNRPGGASEAEERRDRQMDVTMCTETNVAQSLAEIVKES